MPRGCRAAHHSKRTENNMNDWTRTESLRPMEGVVVDAMDSGGHVQKLVYEKGLWWFADRSMYVYFTPTFWRAP